MALHLFYLTHYHLRIEVRSLVSSLTERLQSMPVEDALIMAERTSYQTKNDTAI